MIQRGQRRLMPSPPTNRYLTPDALEATEINTPCILLQKLKANSKEHILFSDSIGLIIFNRQSENRHQKHAILIKFFFLFSNTLTWLVLSLVITMLRNKVLEQNKIITINSKKKLHLYDIIIKNSISYTIWQQ